MARRTHRRLGPVTCMVQCTLYHTLGALSIGKCEEMRMQTLKFSLIAGLLLGWLALWDLDLIHRRDPIGVVLQVLVMLAGVILAWLWLRYWERLVGWLEGGHKR